MVTQHEIIAYYRIDLWLAVKTVGLRQLGWYTQFIHPLSIVQPTTVLKIDYNHYTQHLYIGWVSTVLFFFKVY